MDQTTPTRLHRASSSRSAISALHHSCDDDRIQFERLRPFMMFRPSWAAGQLRIQWPRLKSLPLADRPKQLINLTSQRKAIPDHRHHQPYLAARTSHKRPHPTHPPDQDKPNHCTFQNGRSQHAPAFFQAVPYLTQGISGHNPDLAKRHINMPGRYQHRHSERAPRTRESLTASKGKPS